MSKIKAKLTALLMAAVCCLACIGIGISMNRSNKVVASAATLEEEFTHNGQFTVTQFRDDMPFEIVDSTADGVPEGAQGAVLKITGVGDQSVGTDGAFATMNFAAGKFLVTGVNVVVRVYQPSNLSFRASKKANSAEWKTQVVPEAGWTDVTLSGATNATEDHQIMTTMSMGFRRGEVCYIDSITVVDNDAKKNFTNNGQFDVKQYSTNRTYYVNGADEGLPAGYDGAVLKIDSGATQYVTLDFTGKKLFASDIESMKAKCYIPYALQNSDGTDTYGQNGYEFRIGAIEKTSGGAGAYDVSTWFDADIALSDTNYAKNAFQKDSNGYLTTVTIGLRNKGKDGDANNGQPFYIDGITIDKIDFEYATIDVGPVGVYRNESTNPKRAYFAPLDQTATWYKNSADFTLEYGTGLQYIRNGEVLFTSKTLANRFTNQVKNFYITISSIDEKHGGRQAGDIVRIGGVYTNKTAQMRYIIEESEIIWNGTEFVTGNTTDFSIYDYGKLIPNSNSNGTSSNTPKATQLYMKAKNGLGVPFPDANWNTEFKLESGEGWKLNGTDINAQVQYLESTNAGLYISLGNVEVKTGDVVTVEGTFTTYEDTDVKAKYIFARSAMTWNGTIWEEYIEYTIQEVGSLAFTSVSTASNGDNYIYLKRADGEKFLVPNDGNTGWTAEFTCGSGVGVTLNGEAIPVGIKFPGGGAMFMNVYDKVPQVGDELTVGGTFYNADCALKFVAEETTFTWNGTAWVVVVDEPAVQYTVHELGELAVHNNSNGNTGNVPKATQLYMKRADGQALPYASWDAKFSIVSGGWKLNGEGITLGNLVCAGEGLYIDLSTAGIEVGDVLTVGGTFVWEASTAQLVINESKFLWTGTYWVKYTVEPTTYEIGKLAIDSGSASSINFRKASKQAFEVKDGTWTERLYFIVGSGVGVTLNGEALKVKDCKIPNNMYLGLEGKTAVAGDVLVIGGTFFNGVLAVNYVIEKTTFVFDGTAWSEYISTYELGHLSFRDLNGGNAKFPQFNNESNVEIPNDSTWAAYNCIDGVGAKLNGANVAAIKFPGLVFVEFTTAPQEGDVLVIGGTFYNEAKAQKFVIDETTLWWTGTEWTTEEPETYTIHTLGALAFQKVDSENKHIYLKQSSGTAIANSEWAEFILESGAGVMMNDAAANAVVKFPGCVFIELSSAPVQGDKLTIGGIFYNEELMVKYVIPETTLYWDEVEWDVVDSSTYTEYVLGEMLVATPSAKGASGAKATQLYLKRADGSVLPFPDDKWNTEFAYQSGIGVLLNGEWLSIIDLESTNSGLFLQLDKAGVKVGDVITLGGTYKSADVSAKYIFTESSFMWNGTFWVNYVTNDRLEAYDIITIQDIGLGETVTWNGTVSEVTHNFAPSTGNTTNSVVVRFGYICEDIALSDANLRFRLRGEQWQGITFDLRDGRIYIQHVAGTQNYALENDTNYVIEIGAISMKDGRVWTYVSVNDTMVLSTTLTADQFMPDYFAKYETLGFTNHISIYAQAIAQTTLTDPDGIKVTYVSSAGTHIEKIKKNDTYQITAGKGLKTFIGWVCDGVLYAPGTEIIVDKAMTFTALEIDFTMNAGAAMRIGDTSEKSGIRFTSQFNKAEFDALIGQYGIESIAYGTLIIPYDYLALNQKPNLEDFDPEKDEILKIESTPMAATGDYMVFRGAMQDLYEGNYGRLFAGRAYMEITFASGDVWTIYTAFNSEENVRSVRIIAKAFKADTSEPKDEKDLRYNNLDAIQQAVVDAYIGSAEINLMNYEAYEANAMPIIAWNFPALDPTNNYVNDGNIAIANTMKEAGIKVIGLTGANILSMSTVTKIEQTRQIIDFFWSQGIGTFAFQNNGGNNFNIDFAQSGYPDFSDCEGFMGFLAWDEPSVASIDTIATQVEAFEAAYAGTDVIFMGNLLPSYASIFGSLDSIDKAAFKAYLQKYCDEVLSKVSGTKWLSIDTYPIMANETLLKTFLFDIGTLKTTALANDAHAHVILQSYGFVENGNDDKERMPTEAELRMQMYTAMAFGVDSFSWYVYSPNGHGESDTAVDVNGNIANATNYNALKDINTEWNAISKVYSAFSWKGIILGAGEDNGYKIGSWEISKDNDYKAFEMVMGQLGDYELTASDTKHLASVKTNNTDLNYLMGVMEDKNGNEGYVLCNYNSHEKDRAQTITLSFDTNVTEVVIYRNGEAQTVEVSGKTLTVNLATGEGVIVLPSKAN